MSNDIYYYDDDNNGGGLGIMLFFTILFLPVIPAGDMAIYAVDQMYKGEESADNYVYILTWLAFSYVWFKIWWSIAIALYDEVWQSIILLYAQGLFFSFKMGDTEFAYWSKYVYILMKAIFIGKDN
jgi:hypothetical protein